MQTAVIEYARNVLGYSDANSSEINPETSYPVIDLMPEQKDIEDLGGTMRLGLYPCKLDENSKAHEAYESALIYERHRHRYEFNNNYKDVLVENGLKVAGFNPERNLVEIVELEDHPYYVGCQFHPEFTSTPRDGHPLFEGFVKAARENQLKTEK